MQPPVFETAIASGLRSCELVIIERPSPNEGFPKLGVPFWRSPRTIVCWVNLGVPLCWEIAKKQDRQALDEAFQATV